MRPPESFGKSPPALIIVGAGGHAVSAYSVARSAGFDVRNFVDPSKAGTTLVGVEVVADVSDIRGYAEFLFCMAIGDNSHRAAIHMDLTGRYAGLSFPVLIHRAAVVSLLVTIGEGTVVMPSAVIGPNTVVGRFCILNTGSSIDHDSAMDDYSSLAPGVTAGGRVRIGSRSAISIGAVIKHNVAVGEDSVLGANSYLHEDLPARTLAYGTPARVVGPRMRGEPYL